MRQLAYRLRALRLERGLTVEAVAAQLLVSSSKISRIETGARTATARDVRDLCDFYEVSPGERAYLMDLVARARETSWYQDMATSGEYRTYIGLEEAATTIETVQPHALPGLLQTEDYARALLRGARAPGELSADDIERMIKVRLLRQALLERPEPPRFHAVVDEGVVTRPVGGPRVMAAQVERLLHLADLEHITFQVVPVATGSHPGIDGRFMLLRFADHALRDTVYVEGLVGELFIDRPEDVARYGATFDYLATSVALGPDESTALLRDLRGFWKSA